MREPDFWFFGPMSRQEASDLLMAENEVGVFLVRNSTTISGDLVLCVREENKVSHYIVNRVSQAEQTRFRIGDQMFPDIPTSRRCSLLQAPLPGHHAPRQAGHVSSSRGDLGLGGGLVMAVLVEFLMGLL
ncbi:hypothetical protein HPB48_003533 [Haemaphysalis longicornis]|uniref:SH2 domain-containing protein n=1 Tax=Haemaphysalis longicornis TaxID=44386 RepID=A0A9J6FX62_HAELO|nr:hypothetical protein HPB48_003533 [Haemaphysalis longicornis]